MKTRYTVIIATVVVGVAATLYAVEKQPASRTLNLVRLKSNGVPMAELKLLKDTKMKIDVSKTGTMQVIHPKDGAMDWNSGKGQGIDMINAKGGVTIRIEREGSSPVTVSADEIEAISVPQ